jgi:hypothetical protein
MPRQIPVPPPVTSARRPFSKPGLNDEVGIMQMVPVNRPGFRPGSEIFHVTADLSILAVPARLSYDALCIHSEAPGGQAALR